VPEYVFAPTRPEPDAKGAERPVFLEAVVPVTVVVSIPVCLGNVVALPADIDDGPSGVKEDGRPHILVVPRPAFSVVGVNCVECVPADTVERQENEPGIVRVATRRMALSSVGPFVKARDQVGCQQVGFTLAEVVEQVCRVASIFDIVLEKPIVPKLGLQLAKEERDQVAVAWNESEGTCDALAWIPKRIHCIHSKNEVIDENSIDNDLANL
jgi:hypothetical protein